MFFAVQNQDQQWAGQYNYGQGGFVAPGQQPYGAQPYQAPAQQNVPQPYQPPVQQQVQAQSNAQPSINPQTGQPDYSAQWAEYYRSGKHLRLRHCMNCVSVGLHDQAALIEQQINKDKPRAF